MKLITSFAILSTLALSLSACTTPAQDDDESLVGQAEQDGAVGTAEQDGAVGTAEQQGAVGTAEQDGAVGTAEQALTCTQLYIWYYSYSDGSGNYRWDVTFNTGNGKWYVDEKRIGGGFYKQYILTPDWLHCGDTIALKYSSTTMTGIHGCLPDGREEVHMPDKQRVLTYVDFGAPCVQ